MEMQSVESSSKKPGKRNSKTSNETEGQIEEVEVSKAELQNSLDSEDTHPEIDSQISQIRSEIKQYEETIKAIERGDTFSVPGKRPEDFHNKIVEAENRLRELENSKNEQSSETVEESPLPVQEVPTLNKDTTSLTYDYKFGDSKAKISETETRTEAYDMKDAPQEEIPPTPLEEDVEVKPAPEDTVETPEAPEASTTNETTPPNESAEALVENLETPETIPQNFFERQQASEALYMNLEDARNSFIAEYHKHLKEKRNSGALAWVRAKLGIAKQEDEAELPESLNSARHTYDESKIAYARELAAQLHESGVNLAQINVEIYDRVILNEYSLRKQAEAELWTPKEKGVIRKSLDWYMKQNRFVRVGVSSAILTGAVAATGGLGVVAGSAVFAGRYIRGLVAVTAGQLAGVGFDTVFKDRTDEKLEQSIEDQRREASETTVSGQDPIQKLHDMEKRLEETYSKTEADKRKRLLAKSAVMLAATLGASAGLQKLEELYQSTPSPSKPIPRPEPVTPISISASESVPSTTPDSNPLTVETGDIDTDSIKEIPPTNPFEISSTSVTITSDADNLWSAIKVKLQSEGVLTLLETSGQQTHMVDQVYNVFEKMTPEQLKAIGIASGDIQKVMTGSTVDLSAVFRKPELLESMFDGSTELAQQAIANIEAQGRVISAFQAANPKTLLTPELIKQLVTKAGL